MKDATPNRRLLKISVLRFNPQESGSEPRMQTYEIEEADGMTLFIALNEIREKQDRRSNSTSFAAPVSAAVAA
jgi:fumarate reductase iron-sulfur subunit